MNNTDLKNKTKLSDNGHKKLSNKYIKNQIYILFKIILYDGQIDKQKLYSLLCKINYFLILCVKMFFFNILLVINS